MPRGKARDYLQSFGSIRMLLKLFKTRSAIKSDCTYGPGLRDIHCPLFHTKLVHNQQRIVFETMGLIMGELPNLVDVNDIV
jgi:hypothetical protein